MPQKLKAWNQCYEWKLTCSSKIPYCLKHSSVSLDPRDQTMFASYEEAQQLLTVAKNQAYYMQ